MAVESEYSSRTQSKSSNSNQRIKKKSPSIKPISEKLLKEINPEQVEVAIRLAESEEFKGINEVGLDEMWSFVGNKRNQRWLWHSIDRITGQA